MKRAAGVALVVLLCSACGGSHRAAPAQQPRRELLGTPALASSVAANFRLRDQSGRYMSLSAQRGKVVLVTFLYTHCPDVCPLIAEHLNRALLALGPQRTRVRVLAVSVDPVGDTPRAVRAYAREHRLLPQFHYLLGSRKQLQPVWQSYNVLAASETPGVVNHTAITLLVDPRGKPRVYFDPRTRSSMFVHDVRAVLAKRQNS